MARIKLTGKYAVGQYEYALVDDDMADELSRWKWKAKPNGKRNNVYAVRNTVVNGKNVTLRMHRVVLGMGFDDVLEVDHKNHDALDNRRDNLRPVTRQINALNIRMTMRDLTCRYCGKSFSRLTGAGHEKRELKCDTCKSPAQSKPRSSVVHFVDCVECSKTFTAKQAGALFCTEACRCRARYRRNGSPSALSRSRGLRACDLSVAEKFLNLGNR